MVPGLIFIFVATAQLACLTNSAARASAGVTSTTMDGGICRARGGGICLALCERFGGGLQSMAPRLMLCSAPPMAPKPKPMLSSNAAILLRRSVVRGFYARRGARGFVSSGALATALRVRRACFRSLVSTWLLF